MANGDLRGSTMDLIKNGDLEGLKKLPKEELMRTELCGRSVAHYAADYGYLDILKWLYELSKTDKDFKWLLLDKDKGGDTIVDRAFEYNALEVLKWIKEIAETDEDFKPLLNDLEQKMIKKIAEDLVNNIKKTRSLEYLKKLPKEELPKKELLRKDHLGRNQAHYAAENGRLDALKWIYELSRDDEDFKKLLLAKDNGGYTLSQHAAAAGAIEVLEWIEEIAKTDENFKELLITNKCLEALTLKLIREGDLKGLKKLPKEKLLAKGRDDWNIAHYTAWLGKLDILKWLYELAKTDKDFKKILLTKTSGYWTIGTFAERGGELEVLKWLQELAENDEDFKQLFMDK